MNVARFVDVVVVASVAGVAGVAGGATCNAVSLLFNHITKFRTALPLPLQLPLDATR